MIPRSRRLSAAELDRFFKHRHYLRLSPRQALLLRVLPAPNPEAFSLFSFTVPRRVARFSVQRHLIKRRSLAALQRILPRVRPGFWLAGWCRPAGISLSVVEWQDEWSDCLNSADLLN